MKIATTVNMACAHAAACSLAAPCTDTAFQKKPVGTETTSEHRNVNHRRFIN